MAKTKIRLSGQTDNDLINKSNSASVADDADLSSFGAGGLDGHVLRADGKVALSTAIADIDAGDVKALITKEWSAAKLAAAETTLEGLIDDLEAVVNAADAALQGNIDAEASTRAAADSAATSDRAAIRTEFAVADTAIIGDAAAAYNTLGKLEDQIQAEAVTARAAEAANANDIGHLVTLSGMAADADHMGTFTGGTIADNRTVKQAAQALETALESEASTARAAEAANANDIGHLVTLSGMAADADHMGTFTGTTIADSRTVKQAAQALETALEAEETRAAAAEAANEVHIDNAALLSGVAKDAANMGAFSGATIADNQTTKQALQALETGLESEATTARAAEAANEVHIDNLATLSGVAKDAVNMGAFTGAIIADNQTAKQAFQALETGLESEASTRASADSALSGRLDTVEAGLTAGVVWKASVANLAALDALVEANITNGWAYYVQATKDVYVKVATAGDYQPSGWVTAGFLKIADFTEISGLVTAEAATRLQADNAATTDRGAIRSEFAAADAAIIGDAATAYNTLGKLEDQIQAVDAALSNDIGHLVTLSGVAADADHMGAFSGTTIADDRTVKQAMQALETALEAEEARAAAAEAANEVHIDNSATLSGVAKDAVNMGAFTGATIADNQTVKQVMQALETALESEASSRTSADTTLQSNIDAEATTARAAEGVLAGRATFLEGRVVRQNFAVASDGDRVFTLANLAEHGSIMIYVNGLLQDDGASDDYVMSEAGGVSVVTFNLPGLITADKVSVKYDKRL